MRTQEYFKGKICVVTGAASGIGLAVSRLLLEWGATVAMADRDAAQLETVAAALEKLTGRAHPTTVDVTSQEQVQQLIEGVAARHGRLDILFNNAGIGGTMLFEQATLDLWRRIIDINLWGVIYGTMAATPIMLRQGGGHIVNTASVAGLLPWPTQALYNTTKYAVVGLSESMRYELADQGIHVSVFCPGNVATAIFKKETTQGDVQIKPPADAASPEDAARHLLEGVARREGIITLPDAIKEWCKAYWEKPEESAAFYFEVGRKRRKALAETGIYY